MRERLRQLRDFVLKTDLSAYQGRRSHWPLYVARLTLHIGKQWARDRCPSLASALAFETALSLVPTLAVAFALLKAAGALEARSVLIEFLTRNLFPIHGERLATTLIKFADNVNAGVLGAAGTIFTFLIAFAVFHELERIFNDIWRVSKRRSFIGKFVVFYTLMTLGTTLVGLSLYHTAHYLRMGRGVLGWVTPIFLVWVPLLLANRLLPRAKVRWRSAALGAFVSAVLFEAMKHGFALYLSDLFFKRYTGVYGALALLPLLLMWIYLTWLVVLLGAEVAYAVQNLRFLDALERRAQGDGPEAHINGVVAARLVLAIARAYVAGKKAVTKLQLAATFELPEDVIIALVERLKRADLLMEVEGDTTGCMLTRPPGEIRVEAAFDPFRAVDVRAGSERARSFNLLMRQVEQSRRTAFENVTFGDLLANGEAGVAEAPSSPAPSPDDIA